MVETVPEHMKPLHYQIITLFPELFQSFKSSGLLSRGIKDGIIEIDPIQLRDFAVNDYGQVDDSPYGGGSGLVLRPEPAFKAIQAAKVNDPNAKVVLLTPRGAVLTQKLARALAEERSKAQSGFIIICPRYEGIDERIAEHLVDIEVSIGDYILMGGEIPAMAFIESTARLLPGLLGNPESIGDESFETGLLEYPQYTKPQLFDAGEGESWEVPATLLSGNHKQIADWRSAKALRDTAERRPELVHNLPPGAEISIALMHYPVTDKTGDVVTSSITNIDLHDIARSARTFGLERFYVVHPTKTLRRLADKIFDHWSTGYGFTYNPNRSEALERMTVLPFLDDAILDIETRTGKLPRLVTTSARPSEKSIGFVELRAQLTMSDTPHLLLLGTGWGLAPEIMERADYHLEPIYGPGEYNHLSVRGAAAIILDRLFGKQT